MRILNISRERNVCLSSAEIYLSESEIRQISTLLYRKAQDDNTNSAIHELSKDFYVLKELIQHGGFDRPAIEILCKTAKMEEGKK